MVHINYTQCLQYLVLGCVTSRPKTINIVAVFFPNNYKIEKCVFFLLAGRFYLYKNGTSQSSAAPTSVQTHANLSSFALRALLFTRISTVRVRLTFALHIYPAER